MRQIANMDPHSLQHSTFSPPPPSRNVTFFFSLRPEGGRIHEDAIVNEDSHLSGRLGMG
jgi:hypothetical protein